MIRIICHRWPLSYTGALALAAWGLTGCGRDEIRVYQAPKDAPPAFASAPARMGAPAPAGQIHWTAPESWTDKGASGMRAGSFAVAGADKQTADVSVISLASWQGQELQNVNRWRAQVGLAPITAQELPKHTGRVKIAGNMAPLFEMAGTSMDTDQPTRILAAVLPLPGTAWYFKMTGDDQLVAQQKDAFIAFLESVHFDESAHTAAAAAPPKTAGPSLPQWTVPAGWQQTAPGRMQAARFTAAGGNGESAEISYTVLGGTGGGLLPNVNRWRRQLGLPPQTEAEITQSIESLTLKSGKATVVDMTATDQKKRIVAAIVSQPDQTQFYRLSGPPAAVETQKAAFLKFVQSAQ